MIPFKKLPIGEDEKKAVCEVIDSGYLSRGKKVVELEEAFAKYVGTKYAVSVKSCSMALMFALQAKGLTNGDVVQIPSMTVPLVANMIILAGGMIQFIDQTEWIGSTYELTPFRVFDSAHEVNRDRFKHIKKNDIVCYSFYPTKPITSTEGGMIATNNKEYAEFVRSISNYGRVGTKALKNSWEYPLKMVGWKENMTDMQAAIALCQLNKLDMLNEKRAKVRDMYNDRFGLKNTSLYLYRIVVVERNKYMEYMKDNGVQCGVHFAPLHKMKIYKKHTMNDTELPLTEFMADHTVSLPLHTFLTESDVDKIVRLTEGWNDKAFTGSTRVPYGEISQRLSEQSANAGL